ncbi:GNAT family N-acetyltransferase [Thalassiella azotivora]
MVDDLRRQARGVLTVGPVAPDSAEARAVLRAYVDDVASRWFGRPATATEVDRSLRDDPSHDLAPPDGVLLLARGTDGTVMGCAGLRLVSADVGELKRLYVAPQARGRGVGSALVEGVERWARDLGVRVLRLDTRHDLVEALALYTRCGYRDVPAFNDGPYAERWLAKALAPA